MRYLYISLPHIALASALSMVTALLSARSFAQSHEITRARALVLWPAK